MNVYGEGRGCAKLGSVRKSKREKRKAMVSEIRGTASGLLLIFTRIVIMGNHFTSSDHL